MARTKTSNPHGDAIRIQGTQRGTFPFVPSRAYFEKESLEYPLGRRVFKILKELGTETMFTGSHNRVTGIPGSTPREAYLEGKRTLVVGVRKTMDFQTCKPSAHFQLPLVTGCPGRCHYCYLNTTLGKKPYIRIYVNTDEILAEVEKYINARLPEVTVFEGAATSDPLAVEPYTGSLAKAIAFFGKKEQARFRFVTKFTNVDSLLSVPHGEHTRFRFSINSGNVIETYERGTPGLMQRLEAASKVAAAGYPTGFIMAPVIKYDGWQDDYRAVFKNLKERFGSGNQLTLEIITHRFTQKAKNIILQVFPGTPLALEETERKFKYGQFGYGKYVYQPETMDQIKSVLYGLIDEYVPDIKLEYFI